MKNKVQQGLLSGFLAFWFFPFSSAQLVGTGAECGVPVIRVSGLLCWAAWYRRIPGSSALGTTGRAAGWAAFPASESTLAAQAV